MSAAAVNWTRWTAALLVISALLFAAAVLAEGGTHRETAEAAHSEATEHAEPPDEATEAQEHEETGEEAGHDESAELDAHVEESLFGIDLENPVIVWSFVLVSLALAVVIFANVRPALFLAVGLGGVAALLDAREVTLQLAENNAGVAALAGATAIAHITVAVVAVLAWRAGTIQTST
jgi:hypothetical protein